VSEVPVEVTTTEVVSETEEAPKAE
jgi:hypothetical protein